MTTEAYGSEERSGRLTPADVHNVRFTRATMLRPGYNDAEVDHFAGRVAEEIARLVAEKGELRDQVRALQEHAQGTAAQAPSEQALRIISTAQQTADNYVAEAEEFSRQVTSEARTQYEEQVRLARENAGAIIQAAQEAAAKIAGTAPEGAGTGRGVEELQEQVAYLKAFGQACRVQLRSYLEALLSDVEAEWGKADPALLPQDVLRAPQQRTAIEGGSSTRFVANTAAEAPPADESDDGRPARAGSRSRS
jgi:DivIVA domain-containing protein